jgi:hypothetical protein
LTAASSRATRAKTRPYRWVWPVICFSPVTTEPS